MSTLDRQVRGTNKRTKEKQKRVNVNDSTNFELEWIMLALSATMIYLCMYRTYNKHHAKEKVHNIAREFLGLYSC